MFSQKRQRIAPRSPSAARTLTIGASLILSALLTATALRNPALHWLAWISLLPLFAAVRSLGCPIPSRGGGRNQSARRPRDSMALYQYLWHRRPACVSTAGTAVPQESLVRVPESRSAILRHRRAAGFSPRGLSNTSTSRNCERSYRPFPLRETGTLAIATIAGGLWGGAVFFFAVAGDTPVIPATLAAAVLLTTIPALYTGLAAALTRRIGFNPFILAVGWIGVELALTPLGLPLGIMAGTGAGTGADVHDFFSTTHDGGVMSQVPGDGLTPQTQYGDVIYQTPYDNDISQTKIGGSLCHWIGKFLGYVFIAFLVAIANASLLAVLGCVRLSLPPRRLLTTLSNTATRHTPQTNVLILSPALCNTRPRAPPFFVPST